MLYKNKEIINFIRKALQASQHELLNELLYTFDIEHITKQEVTFLNKLMLNPNHKSHQIITRILQKIKSPDSISFIQKALATNFDYLAYTCSEPKVIAKWFSHMLAAIGTIEAIKMIEDHTKSSNLGIAEEMTYRLSKIEH